MYWPFLEIGKITRVHGLKGEVFVSLFSPSEEVSDLIMDQVAQIYRTGIEEALSRVSFLLEEEKKRPKNPVPALAQAGIKNRSNKKGYIETSIQRACAHKKGLIIKLKGIDTKLEAEALKGAVLSVPKKIFSSLKGENIYLCEVLNFKVYDRKIGTLGTIHAFSSNGAQDLLLVQDEKGTQREIPFIDEFITHVDFDLKKVEVHLPSNWPYASDKCPV
ncbi:MAG: ribosome maturation factor RimM [Bdellovibrionales bacterium]|nr:ribosome maturation factor RimM [Bdellovibrionales bacterium]